MAEPSTSPRYIVRSFRLLDGGREVLAGHRAPLERFAAALNAAPPASDDALVLRLKELIRDEPGYSFAPSAALLVAWGPFQVVGSRGGRGGGL